jgi:hypothetical protein
MKNLNLIGGGVNNTITDLDSSTIKVNELVTFDYLPGSPSR